MRRSPPSRPRVATTRMRSLTTPSSLRFIATATTNAIESRARWRWHHVPRRRGPEPRAVAARGTHRTAASLAAADAAANERESPGKVKKEMDACFDVVERMGRGAVYLGSARVPEDHPHFAMARDLARDVATAYDCTTWSGLGAGMMEAVTRGGMEAGKPVAGFMILLEAGGQRQASRTHPYLPPEVYHTASFFSARKHGLVDAGIRANKTDRTAFFALPGGVGTLDEIFEVLALLQLRRIGSAHKVPFVVMNYDGCFDGLIKFLEDDMVRYGSLRDKELEPHWVVCDDNAAAMKYLETFYADEN